MRALVLSSLAVLACGPDASFVEPTPPVTRFHRVQVAHGFVSEPVVLGLILDLEIPDPIDCATTREVLTSLVRDTVAAAPGGGRLLATQDLAPGCAQRQERRIDFVPLFEALDSARRTFGVERVRPVFLYANNVALPLTAELRDDLLLLRQLGPAPELPSILIGLGTAQVLQQDLVDQGVSWTFAADPRLQSALATALDRFVPFRSRVRAEPVPLFDEADLAQVRQFRWCNHQGWLTPIRFAAEATSLVVPDAPPEVLSTLEPVSMRLPDEVPAPSAELLFEVCLDRCDRFVRTSSGALARWELLEGCQQGVAAP